MADRKIFFKKNGSSWKERLYAIVLGAALGAAGTYYALDNLYNRLHDAEEEKVMQLERDRSSLSSRVRELSDKIKLYETDDYLPRFQAALKKGDNEKVTAIFESYLAGCERYYSTGVYQGRKFCAVTLEKALNHMFNLNDPRAKGVYGSVLEILEKRYGTDGKTPHPYFIDEKGQKTRRPTAHNK